MKALKLRFRSLEGQFSLSQTDRTYIVSRARELAPALFRTEVLFVPEEVLDRTAKKKLSLDEDCVRSLLSKAESASPALAQFLSGCQKEGEDSPSSLFVKRKEVEDFLSPSEERLILVSEKRVRDESKRFGRILPPQEQFRFFLCWEILHNLVRAYLDSDLTEAYERIIERSLAEAFVFSRLVKTERVFSLSQESSRKASRVSGVVLFCKGRNH